MLYLSSITFVFLYEAGVLWNNSDFSDIMKLASDNRIDYKKKAKSDTPKFHFSESTMERDGEDSIALCDTGVGLKNINQDCGEITLNNV